MLSGLEVGRIPDNRVVIGPVPDVESTAGEAILIDGRGTLAKEPHAFDISFGVVESDAEVFLLATEGVNVVNGQPAVGLETVGERLHRAVECSGDD